MAAEIIGLNVPEFTEALKDDEKFERAYKKNLAEAKLELIQKSVQTALEKGNSTLLIFLLKSRCGFREVDDDIQDTSEKAEGIRIGLDKMGVSLAAFMNKDGTFNEKVAD